MEIKILKRKYKMDKNCEHRWGRWKHYDFYQAYGRNCKKCNMLQILNGPLKPVTITYCYTKICPVLKDHDYKFHQYGTWYWREDIREWEQQCELYVCNRNNKRRAKYVTPMIKEFAYTPGDYFGELVFFKE